MKPIWVLVAGIAAGVLLGCTRSADSGTQTSAGSPSSMDKAQAAAANAAGELRAYGAEKKAQFLAAMRARLAELEREIDQLAIRMEQGGEQLRAESKPKLAALRAQAARLREQLAQAGPASDSAWARIKAESEQACAALQNGVAQSRKWVSDKIKP